MTKTLHLRVPAKVNLFLHVTGRRQDGYHLLESIFCPVSLFDELRIVIGGEPGVRLHGGLPGVAQHEDLTVRAALAFREALNKVVESGAVQAVADAGIDLFLTKNIPAGAGLGGGSADAAYTLLGLNHLAGEPLSQAELAAIAVKLGADVPFFLLGAPAFVSGIGEQLQAMALPELPLVIVKPPAHLPTARIFSDPDLTRNAASVRISVFGFSDALQAVAYVSECTANNLQPVAQRHCPDIIEAVKLLENLPRHLRADWVRMTGSGSAVFGVFNSSASAKAAAQMLSEQLSVLRPLAPAQVGSGQTAAESWFVSACHTLSATSLENQMVRHPSPA